jgi:homoserine acetyltransferase
MFAVLIGAAAAAVYHNSRDTNQFMLRTMTDEERATAEYGINTTLDKNNDYLYWGQKHMARLDQRVRPYASYGDALEQYNTRFENKSRLVTQLFKVRNPTIVIPSSDDHLVRMNVITPFVLDPAYQASEPKPLRFQSSGGWY